MQGRNANGSAAKPTICIEELKQQILSIIRVLLRRADLAASGKVVTPTVSAADPALGCSFHFGVATIHHVTIGECSAKHIAFKQEGLLLLLICGSHSFD